MRNFNWKLFFQLSSQLQMENQFPWKSQRKKVYFLYSRMPTKMSNLALMTVIKKLSSFLSGYLTHRNGKVRTFRDKRLYCGLVKIEIYLTGRNAALDTNQKYELKFFYTKIFEKLYFLLGCWGILLRIIFSKECKSLQFFRMCCKFLGRLSFLQRKPWQLRKKNK